MSAPGTDAVADTRPEVEAERHLLAACLVDPEAVTLAREHVQPEHLWLRAHVQILAAVYRLNDRDETSDPWSVAKELGADLEALGGPSALAALASYYTTSANLKARCEAVREAHARRLIASRSRLLIEAVQDPRVDSASLLARMRADADLIEPSLNGATRPPRPIAGPDFAAIEFAEPLSLLGQSLWCEGELALLHAATGLGKTFLAEQLAHAIAGAQPWLGIQTSLEPVPVLIVQCEVSPVRLQQRRHARWPEGSPLVHTLTTHAVGRPIDLLEAGDQLMLTRAIKECGAKAVVLDPIRRLHTAPETAEGFVPLVRAFESIMLKSGAAIFAVHHEPKTSTDQHPRSDIDAARGATVLTDAAKMVVRFKRTPAKLHVLTWSKTSFGEPPADLYVRRDEHGYWEPTDAPVPVADRTQEAVERCLLTAGGTGVSYSEILSYCASFSGSAKGRRAIQDALTRVAKAAGLTGRDQLNFGSDRFPKWVHPSEIIRQSEISGSVFEAPDHIEE